MLDYERNMRRLNNVADEMEDLMQRAKDGSLQIDAADISVKAGHTIVQSVKTQVQMAMAVTAIPQLAHTAAAATEPAAEDIAQH